MSARKRREKRKIALLVRMDASHHNCQVRFDRTDSERQGRAARTQSAMRAVGVGRFMQRKESRVNAAIEAINAQRARFGRVELES